MGLNPGAWRAQLGWLALFVAAGLLGRATIVDGRALSLVWPAAGVAVVWFLSARTRGDLLVDSLLLAAATFVVNGLTGSTPQMGLVFVASNLVQVHVVILLLRRWSPETLPASGRDPLQTPRALLHFLSAAATGCLVAAVLGSTAMYAVSGFFSVDASLTWWGRNVCGVLGVGTVGLLLLHQAGRNRADRTAVPDVLPPDSRRELAALALVTAALYAVDYATQALPLAFLLPATTVWAGMRFRPLVVALHALTGGGAVIWLTLIGNGPFLAVDSVQGAALVAQLFVGMTVMLGLFLAAARAENATLLADLTASRQAVAREARTLAITIGSMNDGIVVVDHQGRVVLLNPAALIALGSSADQLVGRHYRELPLRRADGSAIPVTTHPAEWALAGEQHPPVDVHLAGTGEHLHTLAATPLTAPGLGVTGVLLVLRDIALERARQEELAAYGRVVAHDLLSPLTVIGGWADNLRDALDRPQPPGHTHAAELAMVDRILDASHRMNTLVADLLASATARADEDAHEPVDLAALVRDVAATYDSPGLVTIAPMPPVLGDRALVRQLVDNLLGNAFKYVAPGAHPDVHVDAVAQPDGRVTVRVADRGIGIPAEAIEEVFEEFRRAHSDAFPGTGLGLAICRRIVHRHGGQIRAAAREDGPGTVFEFSLPLAVPAPSFP